MSELLPDSAQMIADVIGVQQTLDLIRKLPRRRTRPHAPYIYVPRRLTPHHPLVMYLGWDDALKLTKHFGGETLMPANCRISAKNRNQRVIDLRAAGRSSGQIAKDLDLSPRLVRYILRSREKTPMVDDAA